MFVVAKCLGGVIEAGIQVEQHICFPYILKIIPEHTSYLSHQYNTVVYQHSLNNFVLYCINALQ